MVIDASIAKAAGEVSQHPTSRHCREFLDAFDVGPHMMAMTGPIRDEWNRHQSRYARRWRSAMMSRRRIQTVVVEPRHQRIEHIRKLDLGEKQADVMEKDCHLLEAALASDKRIASLDDEVRGLFHQHHASIPEIGGICWVNPDRPEEKAIPWLESGAPADRHRMLGNPLETSRKK